jgi:hypothetical protein
MDVIGLIIMLVLGAVGGNAGAAVVKNANLGTTGNSVVGAVGGIVLGWLVSKMTGGAVPADPAATAEAAGNIGTYVRDVIGGGVGGAVLTVVVGLIKNSMAKA